MEDILGDITRLVIDYLDAHKARGTVREELRRLGVKARRNGDIDIEIRAQVVGVVAVPPPQKRSKKSSGGPAPRHEQRIELAYANAS